MTCSPPRSRRFSLTLLLVLGAATLAACGGIAEVPTGTGGQGGAGAQGGSGGSGGGTGGSDSPSTGSALDACEAACQPPSVCDEEKCVAIERVSFVATDTRYLVDGAVFAHRGDIKGCGEKYAPVPPVEILAEEGGCQAYNGAEDDPDWTSIPLDAGDLSVEATSIGAIPLEMITSHCREHYLAGGMDLAPDEGFQPGEPVTFIAAGGDQIAATELTVDFPEDFSLAGDGVFVTGQPFHVQWTGATPSEIFLTASVGAGVIRCIPGAGTSLTIPPSVTAYLTDNNYTTVIGTLYRGAGLELSPSRRADALTLRVVAYSTE